MIVSKMGINLYKGDCLQVMDDLIKQGVKVDAVIADPPYGTTQCPWDSIIPLDKMWEKLNKLTKDNGAIILTSQAPFTMVLGASNIKYFKEEIIWEKTRPTGHFNAKKKHMKAHENILVFYNKQCTYNPQKTQGHKPMNNYTRYSQTMNKTKLYGKCNIEVSGGGNTDRYPRTVIRLPSDKQHCYLHPTQKPLALMEYLVKTYTNEEDLVLDFVAGSGTTGLACKNLNRRFIGIELKEDYYNIARNRLDLEKIEQKKKSLDIPMQRVS